MSSIHVPAEDTLLATLASDASDHDKAVACQKLVYVAGPKSVAPLAALLGHPQLADYARSGLEAIDDESAPKALLEALTKLEGRLLAGVVNSLGVRREKTAVPALQKLAADGEGGVREAALASLGAIATPEAAGTLAEILAGGLEDLRESAGHAALIAAEHLRGQGEDASASRLLGAISSAIPAGPIHEAAKRLAKE